MIHLSRETDYSLLAMTYIAAQPEGRLAYRREIAAHYDIPPEFLAKVLQKLSRRGLVRSYKGMNGGYVLGRRPDRITLAEVIEAVDGPISLVGCQGDDGSCAQESVCPVRSTLEGVRKEILRVLGGISLEDMGRRPTRKSEPGLIASRVAHR
jgi:Rrf2 family protein